MTHEELIALLRDVPRYEPDNPLDNAPSMKADPQGDWLREADVLAALSRAIILKGAADRLEEALDSIATELTGVVPEPDNIWMAIHTAVSVARAALKGNDHE